MKNKLDVRSVWVVSAAAVLWIMGTGLAGGQFAQNKRETVAIDSGGFPRDVQKGYVLLRGKCGMCHGLDIILKPSMSPAQWDSEVKRMQAMASSQFNDEQAVAILTFLNYDEIHRKSELKSVTSVPSSESVMAGREFYLANGCDTCHSLAGKGGPLGSLDGVGTKLSRQQLVHHLQTPKAGSAMPPLPAGTTDVQIAHLADYLLTLTAH